MVPPQGNLQEEEPYRRSYYLYWSLSFKPSLTPQHPIKEKANFTSSLKKSF